MVRLRCFPGLVAICVGCLFAVPITGFALADDAAAEQKIREALNKPTQFQFNDTKLTDVVIYIADRHDINIQIDRKKLEEAGINPDDVTVIRNLQGVTLKSALNLAVEQLGITYVIENEVLIITTPDYARTQSMPRVYDVSEWKGEVAELQKAVELAIPSTSKPRIHLLNGRLIVRGSEPEQQRVVEFLSQLRQPKKIAEPAAVAEPETETSKTTEPRMKP